MHVRKSRNVIPLKARGTRSASSGRLLRIKCGCGTTLEKVGQRHQPPGAKPDEALCDLSGRRM